MSKDYFTPAEFAERQRRVREVMRRKNLDLLLVISPIHINYLTGAAAKAYQVFQCLFFTLEDKPPTLLLRMSDVAEMMDHSLAGEVRGWGGRRYEDPIDAFAGVMAEKGWLRARIGLEMPAYYLSVHNYLKMRDVLREATVQDETALVENLKLVKSPAELAYVRKAAAVADAGLVAIEKTLALGATEREVAAEAHRAMMAAGGDSPPSPMNFVSGERTCYAHGMPSDRALSAGDFMHIEFGGQYRRYCSTVARHYAMGEPSARARQLHDVTHRASQACIAMMKAGVRAEDVHKTAVGVIREAGLERYNLHTTGYGIAPGFPPSWGESINLFDKSESILEAGMVLSIEPPVFIREEGLGARLIDCVIVHEDRAEVLSGYPADLVIVA